MDPSNEYLTQQIIAYIGNKRKLLKLIYKAIETTGIEIKPGIKFLDVFKPKYEITEIEYEVYERLYNGLNVLSKDDLEDKLYDDGGINTNDLLNTRTDRKTKSFFTAKQIQTYFKNEFKRKKNLKDTIDQIPMIIKNLYMAGLINIIEWQYNNQDVYYIPYNKDMAK